ncbi:MAG TPA: hypothetical protein VGQ76_06365 [Thermoanaerobaculia bacterium]|jgi:hypothetical protein|nr:hypothetical protein [Thermoanaerobaculia bacterium]
MKTPTELHPDLTEERLCIIGNIFRDRRHTAVLRHLPEEGDSNWVLGCRCWEWIRVRIEKDAAGPYKDWLSIIEDGRGGAHFVFGVGSVPVRFYRGDPNDPPSKIVECSAIELDAFQSAFPGCERITKRKRDEEEQGPFVRIAYTTDEKHEIDEITLFAVDKDLNPVGDGWVIPKEPTKVRKFLKREEEKNLGKPPIGSRKPKKEHGEE